MTHTTDLKDRIRAADNRNRKLKAEVAALRRKLSLSAHETLQRANKALRDKHAAAGGVIGVGAMNRTNDEILSTEPDDCEQSTFFPSDDGRPAVTGRSITIRLRALELRVFELEEATKMHMRITKKLHLSRRIEKDQNDEPNSDGRRG